MPCYDFFYNITFKNQRLLLKTKKTFLKFYQIIIWFCNWVKMLTPIMMIISSHTVRKHIFRIFTKSSWVKCSNIFSKKFKRCSFIIFYGFFTSYWFLKDIKCNFILHTVFIFNTFCGVLRNHLFTFFLKENFNAMPLNLTK